MENQSNSILLIRSRRCRKSDTVEQFLKNSDLPYLVKYLDDPEAQALAEKHKIKASPGIIIREQSINPYHIIKQCKVENPVNLKTELQELLIGKK